MEKTRKPVLVELANMLANSWRDPGNLANVDSRFFPLNRVEAYFVQDCMYEVLQQDMVGWKVGATSARMRELRASFLKYKIENQYLPYLFE